MWPRQKAKIKNPHACCLVLVRVVAMPKKRPRNDQTRGRKKSATKPSAPLRTSERLQIKKKKKRTTPLQDNAINPQHERRMARRKAKQQQREEEQRRKEEEEKRKKEEERQNEEDAKSLAMDLASGAIPLSPADTTEIQLAQPPAPAPATEPSPSPAAEATTPTDAMPASAPRQTLPTQPVTQPTQPVTQPTQQLTEPESSSPPASTPTLNVVPKKTEKTES